MKDKTSAGGESDVDFTSNPSSISVSWTGVFSGYLSHFEVALGTFPEGKMTTMVYSVPTR